MELIWVFLVGEVYLVAGYVYFFIEGMFCEVLELYGLRNYIMVKGLEGSCDLFCDWIVIIGVLLLFGNDVIFECLLLYLSDYSCGGKEVVLGLIAELVEEI